jgi:hypothetical protein
MGQLISLSHATLLTSGELASNEIAQAATGSELERRLQDRPENGGKKTIDLHRDSGQHARTHKQELKAAAKTKDLIGLETEGYNKLEPVSELQQENKQSPQI